MCINVSMSKQQCFKVFNDFEDLTSRKIDRSNLVTLKAFFKYFRMDFERMCPGFGAQRCPRFAAQRCPRFAPQRCPGFAARMSPVTARRLLRVVGCD